MIAAILRAQWLSMRVAGRRGAMMSAITGLFWYGLWTGAAIAVYAYVSRLPVDLLRSLLPLGLLGICLYWQAVPILSASMGSSLDLRKLRIYPATHGRLFQVEVLLRMTNAVEMLMLLAAVAAALFRNPNTSGWRALLPLLIYVLFNLLLASGTRSLLERLLSRRSVREVVILLLFMLWMVPRFFFLTGHKVGEVSGWERAFESVLLPWTAAAHAALGLQFFLAILSVAAWTCLAAWFGRTQFDRSLRFDFVAAEATPIAAAPSSRARTIVDSLFRFPAALWPDPLAAIVEKELRSLARTPRYRMVFVMGFSFGLMVWMPMIVGGDAVKHSALASHFLTIVCVYALTLLGQVSYWNCFGFDRSAAQIYFAAPPPLRTTLAGKNIASMIFIYLEVGILSAVTLAFRVRFGVSEVIETVFVIGVCAIYMLAMGNIASVNYPRGLNPARVSQGGASSRFQALVFLLYPVTLLPVALAYLAGYAFASRPVFYVSLTAAAGLGAVVYWIAMDSAVSTALARRERIIQDLTASEGPIASD